MAGPVFLPTQGIELTTLCLLIDGWPRVPTVFLQLIDGWPRVPSVACVADHVANCPLVIGEGPGDNVAGGGFTGQDLVNPRPVQILRSEHVKYTAPLTLS